MTKSTATTILIIVVTLTAFALMRMLLRGG